MPEKEGSDEKKDAKAVVNRKQKQMMNQEQLDLSSVAESFGGQIVGEPVELDEEPFSLGTLGTAAAIKYGIPAAIAVGAGAYDYYKKMKGQKGIFPDLSGAVKKVGDTYNKAKDSIMRISGGTDQQRQNQDSRRKSKGGGAYSGSGNQNQNKNNRRKKFYKPEVQGDPVKGKSGGGAPKGDKTKNVFSRIKDIVVGKSKKGQLLRTAGVSGTTATGVGTALQNRRRLPRLPGLRVPDGGHVGRRTAG